LQLALHIRPRTNHRYDDTALNTQTNVEVVERGASAPR
jgi:hypothetical protein